MKYDAVIFDMDGTLLDTLDDLRDAVNHLLETLGMEPRSYEEIRSFVGNGVGVLVKKSLRKEYSDEEFDKLLSEFKDYYREHSNIKTKLYDGVYEAVKTLHEAGVPVAIVSNKVDAAVKTLVNDYFPDIVDVAIGETPEVTRKPAPDMVRLAMQKMGVTNAVYVGDSEVDIATARNSGLPAIIVSWGFRDKDFLYENGAEVIVDSTVELLKELGI